MSSRFVIVLALGSWASCARSAKVRGPREVPTPSVQVGSCAEPDRDGVIGDQPRLERADRDLDGDHVDERIVVDRAMCTVEGNCYWNVFRGPRADVPGDCARYVGTFAAAVLQPVTHAGEDNMLDVRGYWNLQGGRLLLQSYRFMRGGYQLGDALLCKRAADDRLECTDDRR